MREAAANAGLDWEELADDSGLPRVSVRRCTVEIQSCSRGTVRIELISPAVVKHMPPVTPCVKGDHIPISVSAAFIAYRSPLGWVAAWRPGEIVSLADDGDPPVGIFVGGRLFACGTLGVSQGRRAIRIVPNSEPAR